MPISASAAATCARRSAPSSRSCRWRGAPGAAPSREAQVMRALITGDAEAFYDAETESRREAGAPPCGRFAGIVVSSEDQGAAHEIAQAIGRAAPQVEGMQVYGPAPAPLAMLRGRHRYRLLVHARRALDVQDVIRAWLGALEWPAKVRVVVDVDPYSFV